MKRIITTTIILLITINALHTQHTAYYPDSTPKEFFPVAANQVIIGAAEHRNGPTGKTGLEEPAGILNQAGNVIFPALKMYQ